MRARSAASWPACGRPSPDGWPAGPRTAPCRYPAGTGERAEGSVGQEQIQRAGGIQLAGCVGGVELVLIQPLAGRRLIYPADGVGGHRESSGQVRFAAQDSPVGPFRSPGTSQTCRRHLNGAIVPGEARSPAGVTVAPGFSAMAAPISRRVRHRDPDHSSLCDRRASERTSSASRG